MLHHSSFKFEGQKWLSWFSIFDRANSKKEMSADADFSTDHPYSGKPVRGQGYSSSSSSRVNSYGSLDTQTSSHGGIIGFFQIFYDNSSSNVSNNNVSGSIENSGNSGISNSNRSNGNSAIYYSNSISLAQSEEQVHQSYVVPHPYEVKSVGNLSDKRKLTTGGGLSASLIATPLSWALGVFFLCAVVGTSVWATLDSSSSKTNYVFDSTDATDATDDSTKVTTLIGDSNAKPNVIYILADDLGWNSIGYQDYDLDFVTPTLTTMAKAGVILNSFYAQELCTPARAALLTGRYPLTVGMQYSMVQTAIPWGLDVDETLLPEVLKADGYKTHMLGKWHIGHYTPRMLPTARGFDTFTGFLNGENYYWSKRNPDHNKFHDLMYSDTECYIPYTDDDMHDYSTHFYRNKAKDIISSHDQSNPLFLFMSFQAVHDPFVDIDIHLNGIPKEYVAEETYEKIISEVKGRKRRQYAMSLSIMDSAVSDIVNALDDAGMIDNTVILFSSDNGGCYGAGGKNGPLRGTKGSLFEGGTKVDAFIWSPMLPSHSQGIVYNGLFHITDMMPTILAITNTNFSPEDGYELDGYNHLPAIIGDGSASPREYMLYNHYYNVDHYQFDMWINGSFAVRNSQYKLMHAFNSSIYAVWYQPEETLSDDDAITEETRCAASSNNDGDFTYWLFDLENDPYETTNLYYSSNPVHKQNKEALYAQLDEYAANSYEMTFDFGANRKSFQVWKEHGDWMVPYIKVEDILQYKGTFPEDCYGQDVSWDYTNTEVTEETTETTETDVTDTNDTDEKDYDDDAPVIIVGEDDNKHVVIVGSDDGEEEDDDKDDVPVVIVSTDDKPVNVVSTNDDGSDPISVDTTTDDKQPEPVVATDDHHPSFPVDNKNVNSNNDNISVGDKDGILPASSSSNPVESVVSSNSDVVTRVATAIVIEVVPRLNRVSHLR